MAATVSVQASAAVKTSLCVWLVDTSDRTVWSESCVAILPSNKKWGCMTGQEQNPFIFRLYYTKLDVIPCSNKCQQRVPLVSLWPCLPPQTKWRTSLCCLLAVRETPVMEKYTSQFHNRTGLHHLPKKSDSPLSTSSDGNTESVYQHAGLRLWAFKSEASEVHLKAALKTILPGFTNLGLSAKDNDE